MSNRNVDKLLSTSVNMAGLGMVMTILSYHDQNENLHLKT